jgi:hypothetical protein
MFDHVAALGAANARIGSAHAEFLSLLVEVGLHGSWREDGARDLAHWASMRYGMSTWKARRWIDAAHAIDRLPSLSEALSGGRLGIDKVVELCRFATPDTEERLIGWAGGVSCAAVRQRADREIRASIKGVREAERSRTLEWWYFDEGRRFGLYAEMSAASGPSVVRAIERMTERVPAMPGEEDESYASARRADALSALCSASLAGDPEPDRATVVVHAQLEGLRTDGRGGGETEGGPVLHPQSVRRMLCNARVQTVIEDQAGRVVGLGRVSRQPSVWMVRQVRYRDRECRFPGCAPAGSPRPTTSGGGGTAVEPTSTTSC